MNSINIFSVKFQPIVCLTSRAVMFQECLFRIIGSETQSFITMAEIDGTIVDIDHFVLDSCIHKLASDLASEISVNFSVRTIEDYGDSLINKIKDNAWIATRLIIEITETYPIRSTEKISVFLHKARSLGIRIAVDDFGDGHSNLERVELLKPDFIKISWSDRTAAEMPEDLYQLIKLCERIGSRVIAERIENENSAETYAKAGVHFGQGYYFGKPN